MLDVGFGVSGILQPGEHGYAMTLLDRAQVPSTWGWYHVRVHSFTTTEVPYPYLRITNDRNYYDTDDFLHIAGTVTNDGLRVTHGGLVLVVIRRSNGELHEIAYNTFTYAPGHELAPSESYDFDIALWRGRPRGRELRGQRSLVVRGDGETSSPHSYCVRIDNQIVEK